MKKIMLFLGLLILANVASAKDLRCKKWANGKAVRANAKKFMLSDSREQIFTYEVINNLESATNERLKVQVTVKNQDQVRGQLITALSLIQSDSHSVNSKTEVVEGTRSLSSELSLSGTKVGIVCSISLL